MMHKEYIDALMRSKQIKHSKNHNLHSVLRVKILLGVFDDKRCKVWDYQ